MTAMMIDDGKRVAAGGTRLQWHLIPIADIDLIARNTRVAAATAATANRLMHRKPLMIDGRGLIVES